MWAAWKTGSSCAKKSADTVKQTATAISAKSGAVELQKRGKHSPFKKTSPWEVLSRSTSSIVMFWKTGRRSACNKNFSAAFASYCPPGDLHTKHSERSVKTGSGQSICKWFQEFLGSYLAGTDSSAALISGASSPWHTAHLHPPQEHTLVL